MSIYQLKLTLKYAKPPVWRRILVNSNITMRELAHILMISCDYVGNHYYGFVLKKKNLTEKIKKDFAKNNKMSLKEAETILYSIRSRLLIQSIKSGSDLPLESIFSEIFDPQEDTLSFEYDFTSNIEYKIVVEKITEETIEETVEKITDKSTDEKSLPLPNCTKAVGITPSEYADLGSPDVEKINMILQNPLGYVTQYKKYEKEMNKVTNDQKFDPEVIAAILASATLDEHGRPYLDWSKIPKNLGGKV